jgi:hypothetical protein
LSVLLVLSSLASVQTSAQTSSQFPGQKAGLWELKPIKQTMDGKDMLAQLSASQEKMREAMAKMSPDQRAKMEAMMGGAGFSQSGTMKVCVSPAMAAKNQPMTDKDSQCPPAKISHSGNQTTFEINCTKDGRTTVGSGTSTVNGEIVSTDMNVDITDPKGRHNIQSITQMTYLGADCQGITPADQLMKNMKALPH